MTDGISWLQIITALMAAGGGVAGIVALINVGVKLWDRRRKARLQAATTRLADAVELKRLAAEAEHIDDEAVKAALWKIIEERKEEIDGLKLEIIELKQSYNLSRPTIVKLYTAVKGIRKQINIIDTMVNGTDQDLSREVEILRQRLDELEQALP